ncbi:MAG: ATP-binding protein [bacterium]
MTERTFDVTAYLNRSEGSHFERKSLREGDPTRRQPRDRRTVRDQIARYVAGFANAEGGVLLLGVEDDGTLTGHSYPPAVVDQMLQVPVDRLHPPQSPGFRVAHGGFELLVFDVAMASTAVQVVGDGYPLRMGDQTMEVRHDQIEALKFKGLVESHEARPSTCVLASLDAESLAEARAGAGLSGLPPERYLLQRRLADWRGSQFVLRTAAELLFSRDLPEHPNAGIRIFRVVGTERRTGLEYNVEELPRIEGSLPTILKRAYEVIGGLLRRPSRLTAGGRFRQTTEYPEFAWKEAILNAVGHRDYAVTGRGVEVSLFDDRIEVTSPGALMPEVDLKRLLELERIHYSRNPRIVRALVDLGFMREQGEGIPRMFAEMAAQFLPRPELDVMAGEVRVTLRNTMTLSGDDRAWIEGLADFDLSPAEFRALLEARQSGQVDNARMRAVMGLDTLGASKLLRGLRDRGLLRDQGRGVATYYVLPDSLGGEGEPSATLDDSEGGRLTGESGRLTGEGGRLTGESGRLTGESGTPRAGHTEVASDSGSFESESTPATAVGGMPEPASATPSSALTSAIDPAHAVPPGMRAEIEALGRRPGRQQLRRVILRLCEGTPRDLATLSSILNRNPEALARHVRPMVAEGALRRLYPDQESHPRQAYVATQAGLGLEPPAAAPKPQP